MKKERVDPSVTLFYPAPVALVTCSRKGDDPNIITIAWTGVVSSEPPTVGIAIRPSRHSHGLVAFSREFGINFPKRGDLEKVDFCGVASGKKVNKFEKCEYTPFRGKEIHTPLIKECPVNLECVVTDTLDLGSHTLFLGKVVAAHVDEDLWEDETLNVMEAQPLVYLPPTVQYVSLGSVLGRYSLSRGRL
jgi:flavin reductase (DIM6/NTAB) family NADH-FMN oxidoreductase RutF